MTSTPSGNAAGTAGDPRTVNAAVYANGFRPIDPWVGSTGLRSSPLRHRSLGWWPDPRVAEDFLVSSRLRRHDRETEHSIQSYFNDSSVVMLALAGQGQPGGYERHELPRGIGLRMDLGHAIERRRSVRIYTGDRIELAYVATLLRAAAGVTWVGDVELAEGGRSRMTARAGASGGGLYPVDVHLAALNVDGLPRGLHVYDPAEDVLWETAGSETVDRLLRCFAVPDEAISISRANAIFLLVGRPWKTMRKYGSRGMRFLLLEAGILAGNLALASTALGLASVDCASTYEDEAHEAMGIQGLYEELLHTVIVGCPA